LFYCLFFIFSYNGFQEEIKIVTVQPKYFRRTFCFAKYNHGGTVTEKITFYSVMEAMVNLRGRDGKTAEWMVSPEI